MSRLFNGDDEVAWTIGSVVGTGAWTFAFLVKLTNGTDGTWHSLLNLKNGANTPLGSTRHGTNNTFSISMNSEALFSHSTITLYSAQSWCVAAASRPAGAAQTVAFTIYPIGGSPTSGNMTATLNNATAATSLQFGNINGVDDLFGRVCAIGFWNTNLNQASRESLASTLTRANWLSTSPAFLVDELDAFATDYAGTSTRSSITGTDDDADDPTGWASWAGAAAEAELPDLDTASFPKFLLAGRGTV